MANRVLCLALVFCFSGCASTPHVWKVLDIEGESDTKFGVNESRTIIQDGLDSFYLDSTEYDWQHWQITYGGETLCSMKLEGESIQTFWADNDYLYAHKMVLGGAQPGKRIDLIVRFDENCREQSCVVIESDGFEMFDFRFSGLTNDGDAVFSEYPAAQTPKTLVFALDLCPEKFKGDKPLP